MKPQEKAKIIADCCSGCTFSCRDRLNCHREEIYVSCMQMHEWDKEQFIKWTVEWLKNNADGFIVEEKGYTAPYIEDECYVRFKKDAEEELWA